MGMKACCPEVGYNRLRVISHSREQQAMSNVTVFVGLDYHQEMVEVCVLDPTGRVLSNRPCRNDTASMVDRVANFGDRVFAAVECCSGVSAARGCPASSRTMVGRRELRSLCPPYKTHPTIAFFWKCCRVAPGPYTTSTITSFDKSITSTEHRLAVYCRGASFSTRKWLLGN